MKVADVVLSARKSGNGFSCMKYCLDGFADKGLRDLFGFCSKRLRSSKRQIEP